MGDQSYRAVVDAVVTRIRAGGLPMPGNPVKISGWPDPAERPAAPALDEHGAAIRAELGPPTP